MTSENDESVVEETKEEAPSKPSLIRQVVPWFAAAGILAFMFYKVDFAGVWAALKATGSNMYVIIGAYLVYCLMYWITDVLGFWRAYNWFNASIGLAETARLRFASYTVQAVNGALTEIMCVLYMYRVKKVKALESTGTAGFVYFNENVVLVLLLTFCAFFLPEQRRVYDPVPGLGVPFWTVLQGLLVAVWVFIPIFLIFWRSGLKDKFPRVRDAGVLTAFNKATLLEYLEVFLYRFSNNLVSVGVNIVILRAMGIDAPIALMAAAVPIIVNLAYTPASAMGFGGPQLAAYYLLKGYAAEDQVVAYSLIWSALFFLTRFLAGIGFLKPVYSAAFPPVPKA